MIGLDTNVLVRYITQDHPEQSARATRLMEKACTRKNPCHVSRIVLCELVWVLGRAYGYSKKQIAGIMEQLLVTAELDVEAEGLAWQALKAWREGPADFSDYLLVLGNHEAGCKSTFSFDTRLGRHPFVSSP